MEGSETQTAKEEEEFKQKALKEEKEEKEQIHEKKKGANFS